jgi:para-aminobenzoate synthetase component 1
VGGVFQQRSLSEFTAMVREAKAAIAAGDIYQANLSSRFERKFDGKPVELYRYLAVSNPSPYAAMLKMGEQWIVSASPELLVSLQGRALRTRPIAGTRPRGKDRKEDKKKSGQLLLSPKERAEHIMLVDLERNDLGRIAEAGSVRVTERFVVERYSHVMHIVSEVVGRLRKNLSAVDALRALFPGGTISGCPKYRSIEIIENLEGIARGPFYGSAGFVTGGGDAIFNILIRTAAISSGRVALQAGAGIVADSNPRREFKETRAKAQALLEALAACA